MFMNIFYRCVLGALTGWLAANAVREGYTLSAAFVIFVGVVAASWTEELSKWVTSRFTSPPQEAHIAAMAEQLAGQYVTLLRVHQQLTVGMSELRDIVTEVAMPDHTRRILMASMYQTADRMLTVMEELDEDEPDEGK